MTNLLIIIICSIVLKLIGIPIDKFLSRLFLTLTVIFTICYIIGYLNPPQQYTTLQF